MYNSAGLWGRLQLLVNSCHNRYDTPSAGASPQVPLPNFDSRDVVLMDYPVEGGVLKVRVKAANAGYMLHQWHVDCSPAHSLRGRAYDLWLRDPLALYGSESAFLAPGYRDPKSA